MAEQSSMHLYLNWTKEQMDEMDAALASLEVKARIKPRPTPEGKADEIIADLKKRRDEFQALLKTQAKSGEAAWARAKTELDKQWNGFEAQVQTYFESAGKQIEQQQATFKDIAAAQAKAWSEAADKFKVAAGKVAEAQRADLEAALQQMKSDASEAETRLQKLNQAGSKSWSSAQHCTRKVAQGLRSGQPGRVGRTEGLWLEELRTSFATSRMEHRKDRAIRPQRRRSDGWRLAVSCEGVDAGHWADLNRNSQPPILTVIH